MKKLTKTPKLRRGTTTAYALCQRVVREIEAEPKRLLMDGQISSFRGDRLDILREDGVKAPRCGTVACIGGWIGLLASGEEHGGGYAVDLLASGDAEMRQELDRCFYTFPEGANPGTKRYAREALAAFKAWMEKYRADLQARTLELT